MFFKNRYEINVCHFKKWKNKK